MEKKKKKKHKTELNGLTWILSKFIGQMQLFYVLKAIDTFYFRVTNFFQSSFSLYSKIETAAT